MYIDRIRTYVEFPDIRTDTDSPDVLWYKYSSTEI